MVAGSCEFSLEWKLRCFNSGLSLTLYHRTTRTCLNQSLRFLPNLRFGFGNHCTGKVLNILMMPSRKNIFGSHSPLYTCSAQIPGSSLEKQALSSIQLLPYLDHLFSIRGSKTWADSLLVGVHVTKCSINGSWLGEPFQMLVNALSNAS